MIINAFISVTANCWFHLGCWADKGDNRAISGGNRLSVHESEYGSNTKDLIQDCYDYTKSQGWTVFAAQNGQECYTSADAESTYQKNGGSTGCSNGKGGFNAMDVYKIQSVCPGKFMYL